MHSITGKFNLFLNLSSMLLFSQAIGKTYSETGYLTFDNKPLGSMEKPLVLRTYVPSIGIDYDDVLPNHARGLTSPKYSPSSGKESNSNYLPIDGVPAAISVNLGKTLSYVWDTTECRLLYAWTDGFLDMKNYWGERESGRRKGFGYVPKLYGFVFIRHRVFILFELIKNQSRKLARPNMSVILWEKTAYHPMILNPGSIQYP